MKKIMIYLAVLIPLLFANICQAEMTGAQWLNFVSSSEPIDHIQALQVINSVPLKYCECLGYSIEIPAEVTPGQLVKVVEKYLSDHPEMLHLEINYIICTAYRKAWGKTNIRQK
ncbi:MAG: hypothetical protein JRI79_16305 [Deltaproteobacteria bacterium]|nr:hypothetical protein [Deltaproteobacteria bacterium]MBW2298652.1 hypothetical protein [Deltaproteobacteria bacterium]